MRIRHIILTLGATSALACLASAALTAPSPAGRKAGISKSARHLTPSERAGIPPEAFGSPVLSPDSATWVWIADEGDGPNLYTGDTSRRAKRPLTRYRFTRAHDAMPGLPILWSPDARHVAYFEYSHAGLRAATSSHAIVVAADGSGLPVRVSRPGKDLNTRPTGWLSNSELRFKGLLEARLTGGEDSFVLDLRSGMARTEAEYLAAKAALKAAADSAARAASPRPAKSP